MDNADYAYEVFKKHFATKLGECVWVGAEIGPGDSVFSAILAQAHGADAYWLIDSGDFADHRVDRYLQMAASLEKRGLLTGLASLADASEFDTLLNRCRANYLTNGIDSMSLIPDGSVNFVWSHAVLEHIQYDRFDDFCKQMFRILSPGGRASHQVDFSDHIVSSINSLRFSRVFWERASFAKKSGFYTNRIRQKAMKTAFENAGFIADIYNESRWSYLPLPRSKLATEFRCLEESDLLVSGCHFVLTKPDRAHKLQKFATK
jgi:SAM-dependent methyltransferase